MQREFSVVYMPIGDGWVMATVPELPGAVTQGRTMEEASEMVQEAMELLLQIYREHAASAAPSGAGRERPLLTLRSDTAARESRSMSCNW